MSVSLWRNFVLSIMLLYLKKWKGLSESENIWLSSQIFRKRHWNFPITTRPCNLLIPCKPSAGMQLVAYPYFLFKLLLACAYVGLILSQFKESLSRDILAIA